MKNKYYLLPLVALLLLSSCNRKNDVLVSLNKDDSIIYNEDNTDIADYTTSLSLDEISANIANQKDFVLVTYSSTCKVCNKVKPFIINYICNTQYIINSLCIYDFESSDIKNTLDLLYVFDEVAVPRIFFVHEGTTIYVQSGFSYNELNQNYINKTFNYYIK